MFTNTNSHKVEGLAVIAHWKISIASQSRLNWAPMRNDVWVLLANFVEEILFSFLAISYWNKYLDQDLPLASLLDVALSAAWMKLNRHDFWQAFRDPIRSLSKEICDSKA